MMGFANYKWQYPGPPPPLIDLIRHLFQRFGRGAFDLFELAPAVYYGWRHCPHTYAIDVSLPPAARFRLLLVLLCSPVGTHLDTAKNSAAFN
jgi:hypothetical protein